MTTPVIPAQAGIHTAPVTAPSPSGRATGAGGGQDHPSSLEIPAIIRRNPSVANDIMRRNQRGTPARNQWSEAVRTLNNAFKTIFAVMGVIAILVLVLLLKR